MTSNNTQALPGYGEIKLLSDQKQVPIEAYCNSFQYSLTTKSEIQFQPGRLFDQVIHGPYTYESIMHFGSMENSNPNCSTSRSKNDCVLMKYSSLGQTGEHAATKFMETITKPTDRDATAIQDLYPWIGPPRKNVSQS
ncbi:hypothetical protein P154DRAFT_535392 [Amniculicola lignicola CBS 123094]|uniref:Peptidase M12A domain-containing protein n=1 Tax=Amniculicola lignicola CBS 123094 TaxID=1392246 RepID=A0A6A5WFT6_9PLEO|nr:hypothetical protein P154DRAFT_535392 [Amniculicola lignicola CBS 123094]